MIAPTDRISLLMEGSIDDGTGKMGLAVLRYHEAEVVCAIDSRRAGRCLGEMSGIPRPCPIVASLDDALQSKPTVLILGGAPPGGRLTPAWEESVVTGLRAGLSIVNGLHDPLAHRFGSLAPGQWVWDVRAEPDGLTTATGAASALDNRRVLFLGTDMSVGKMTAALEVQREAKRRGVPCGFVATGQCGMVVTGEGVPLDAIRLDFAAGAVECEVVRRTEPLVLIEGQGSLNHPASSATLPLMRGAMPTHLVLCHRAGMKTLPRWPWVTVPELPRLAALAEELAAGAGAFARPRTCAIALNTHGLEECQAAAALDATRNETGLPVEDPVRSGGGVILDALLD